jgi:hypothetical protein
MAKVKGSSKIKFMASRSVNMEVNKGNLKLSVDKRKEYQEELSKLISLRNSYQYILSTTKSKNEKKLAKLYLRTLRDSIVDFRNKLS